MEATLAPVDAPLIEALQLRGPCRIADVGTGGGATALAIMRRAPAGSTVDGYDISPALVDAACARIAGGARGIRFRQADMAMAAPPEGAYDRLVSRFGVMFFDDPSAAFTNLVRWLVPGGRFAFAVWGRPADNPWLAQVREAVAEHLVIPPSDPAAPGPFRYADADALVRILAAAGFAELAVQDWRGALPIGGGLPAGEAAGFALASFSSFAELLDGAGASVSAMVREALTRRWSRDHRGDAVRLEARVHLVSGRRPLTPAS
jgi:SAM-dependent methyltransferase